jgi:hypothetical protein
MNFIRRQKIVLEDRLRFSPVVRSILFRFRYHRASANPATSGPKAAQRVRDLCAAARLAETPSQLEAVESVLSGIGSADFAPMELLEGDTSRQIPKAIILKPYHPETGERGVIFISFEYQWARLLLATNLEEFAGCYDLVVSPTWTPPHSLVNWAFPRIYPEPIHCLISNQTDLETFSRLSPNYRMVNLYASSWVDPDLFTPLPRSERDIDILMLANFGTYKRHHVLFKALRNLPRGLRVVLVGQPNGSRTAEVLMREADVFGVRDRIELRQRVTDEEVVDLLCRSKVSLINSKREGSCVAIVESMFANTPVGLIEGAQIGSAAFINPQTGVFLREKHFARDLEDFLARADGFDARNWCLSNKLSARDSSEYLNGALRRDAGSRQLPWTRDIIPFHWRPNPVPFDSSADVWQQAERRRIHDRFGIEIGP